MIVSYYASSPKRLGTVKVMIASPKEFCAIVGHCTIVDNLMAPRVYGSDHGLFLTFIKSFKQSKVPHNHLTRCGIINDLDQNNDLIHCHCDVMG